LKLGEFNKVFKFSRALRNEFYEMLNY